MSAIQINFDIEGGDFSHAGYASSQVKRLLKQLSVDSQVIKRVVVALYEAEVNIVAHAYSGKLQAEICSDRIVLTLVDRGPGIPDIPKAMQKGFSTASDKVREMGFGAGMGLPNMKKNVDVLDIESVVGQGTTVRMITYFESKTDGHE